MYIRFVKVITKFYLLQGGLATGSKTIAVGAVEDEDCRVTDFSAEGPTEDGRPKPEVSAPGYFDAAASLTGNGTVPFGGTSVSAPIVAGVIVLLFQAAQAAKKDLTIDQTRNALQLLTRSITSKPNWNPLYGHGCVKVSESDIANVLSKV
jgi:subtilisin family serine protease